jgi:hypothetical protein
MTQDEFELRGMLATLLCWHRLTQAEQEDLLRFAAAQLAQEHLGHNGWGFPIEAPKQEPMHPECKDKNT